MRCPVLLPAFRPVLALAISLGLHLVILFPPAFDWRPKRPLPEPMRFNVTLKNVAPPAPVTSLPPPPMPTLPETPPAPTPPQADALPPVSEPVAVAPPDPPSPAPAPDVEVPPSPAKPLPDNAEPNMTENREDEDYFPPRGEARYVVYRGTQGFEVGRATHQWEIGEGRYRLTSLMETTGLAALLRPLRVETESQGAIGPYGLQPDTYRQRNSKSGEESVLFDWAGQQLRIGDKPPETLIPGSQDLLSLQYQFSYVVYPLSAAIGPKSTLDFWVATSRKYELTQFEILGSETLEIPAGSFYTLHLQSVGNSQTDLWLAPDYLMLPMKIRFTDQNGDTYEQAIREIILEIPDEETPDAAPDTPPPNEQDTP